MVRIALVSDIHCGLHSGFMYGEQALDLLTSTMDHIKPHTPDLFIDLGDRLTDQDPTIDQSRLNTLAQIFKTLPCLRIHIQGNHDILPRETQEHILGGCLGNQAYVQDGWHLLFLDTAGPGGGTFSAQTITWLDQELKANTLPKIVFSHQPLHGQEMIGNRYFESEYREYCFPKRVEVIRALLEGCPLVQLCVNGHAHWHDFREVHGVRYLNIDSLSDSWHSDGQPARSWSLLELGTDQIHIRHFGLEATPQQTLPIRTERRHHSH